MGRKAFTPEQIIFKLRGVEVLVGQGESISLACRKIAVTEQTYNIDGKGVAIFTLESGGTIRDTASRLSIPQGITRLKQRRYFMQERSGVRICT